MRLRRGRLVHVKRLRIVLRRECLDVLGGERVRAERNAIADSDVVEIFHAAAPGWRRCTICGQTSVIAFSPRSLNTSQRNVTKPRSGLLCEARTLVTLPRTVRASPGRIGFSHFTS